MRCNLDGSKASLPWPFMVLPVRVHVAISCSLNNVLASAIPSCTPVVYLGLFRIPWMAKLSSFMMGKVLIQYVDNGSSRYDGKDYLEDIKKCVCVCVLYACVYCMRVCVCVFHTHTTFRDFGCGKCRYAHICR